MKPSNSDERQFELEEIVDAVGIATVIEDLALIARGKADHLRANWQDDLAAKQWDHIATRIERADDETARSV